MQLEADLELEPGDFTYIITYIITQQRPAQCIMCSAGSPTELDNQVSQATNPSRHRRATESRQLSPILLYHVDAPALNCAGRRGPPFAKPRGCDLATRTLSDVETQVKLNTSPATETASIAACRRRLSRQQRHVCTAVRPRLT